MAHMSVQAQSREETVTEGEEGHNSGCYITVPAQGYLFAFIGARFGSGCGDPDVEEVINY